jgi:hypothetical protein
MEAFRNEEPETPETTFMLRFGEYRDMIGAKDDVL